MVPITTTTSSITPSPSTSSGWPWMKDEMVAIADPISPVHDRDDRPAIKELITKHRVKINQLKTQLQKDEICCELYDETKHDDLWFLRFLLSHSIKIKPSFKAAKHTLQFRKEYDLDSKDLRHIHMGFNYNALNEAAKSYQKCCDPNTFRFVVMETCVVSYVQWCGFNQPKLLKECDSKHWLPGFAFITEWCYQWNDYITRTTGRLTKTIRIIDLDNITWNKNCQLRSCLRDAKALNAMEDIYPQLLQSLFLTNAPNWIETPWRTLIRPLVPKRVLLKFDFLEPATIKKDYEIITKYIPSHRLPIRYGGQYPHWPDNTPPPPKSLSEIPVTE